MAKSYACVFNFFPYHKRLEIHPMGNAKFASKNFTNHFIFTDVSQNKRGFKKNLSIQIIEERINLQRGFLPQNSTAHRQNILQQGKNLSYYKRLGILRILQFRGGKILRKCESIFFTQNGALIPTPCQCVLPKQQGTKMMQKLKSHMA